jgi:hypothetical protein
MVPDKVGIVLAGTWNGSTRFERSDPTQLDATHGSLFTHIVYTASHATKCALSAGRNDPAPFESRLAFNRPTASERTAAHHGQLVWDRRPEAISCQRSRPTRIRERALDLARLRSRSARHRRPGKP